MKNKLFFVLLLLIAHPAWATLGFIQTKANNACGATSSTCTTAAFPSSSLFADAAIVFLTSTVTTDNLTAVSDPTGSTYTIGPFSGSCRGTDTTAGRHVDCAYSLSLVGGATTITCTRSSSTSATWGCIYIELSTTNPPFIFDNAGNRDQSSAVTSAAGVTLTLSGANDAIAQIAFTGASISAVSSCYSTNATFASSVAWAVCINTASGTAPTWTQTSGRDALGAIALKESAPSCKSLIALMGAGCR